MSTRRAPRLALWILNRFVRDNEPLKGDLIEDFEHHGSRWSLWRQVIGAVFTQGTFRGLEPPNGAALFLGGAGVLMLVSFEVVFVTNLIDRLTFGPPLPNINGYLYLSETEAPISDPIRPSFTAIYAVLGASLPIGWLIAQFHQRHRVGSICAFMLSAVFCASINRHFAFAIQVVTALVFILGLLAGGNLSRAGLNRGRTAGSAGGN
jgi:hypothetical protein